MDIKRKRRKKRDLHKRSKGTLEKYALSGSSGGQKTALIQMLKPHSIAFLGCLRHLKIIGPCHALPEEQISHNPDMNVHNYPDARRVLLESVSMMYILYIFQK